MVIKKKIIFLYLALGIASSTTLMSQSTPPINQNLKIYQDTVTNLNQTIAYEPNAGLAYLSRAYAYMMLGSYQNALKDYEIAYEKTLAFDALLGIQWAHFTLKNYEKTVEVGEEILDREPNNYYALFRMAEAYYEVKEYKKAYRYYSELIDYHGEEALTVWKKGLAAYYARNYIKADSLFKRAYELAPSNPGIEYSYKNSKVYPYFVVTPEFSSSNFKGSSFLGRGERAGLNLAMGLDENWSFRIGYSYDKTQNLNASKGVENYITDPLSLAYMQAAQRSAPLRYPTSLSYFTGTATNVDNLLSLYQSQNYLTNRYSLGTTYKLSEHWYLFGSGNYLASNSSYLNAGHTEQLGITYSDHYTVSFSGSAIKHPSSKGGQSTLSLNIPLFDHFYSASTISGQVMSVHATAEKEKEQWLIYYFITDSFTNTVLNNSEVGTKNRNYGFYQQEFGFHSTHFFSALGGRIGKARNPLFGESWVYPGFDMQNGGYARIGVKWDAFTIQIDGSRDYWLDSRNDRPVSDTVKLSVVGVF
jgi:hypothetical protein